MLQFDGWEECDDAGRRISEHAGATRQHACSRTPTARSVLQAFCKGLCKTGFVLHKLDIRVLGNVEVRHGTEPVTIGGPKPRLLLAMLVAARGGVVGMDLLCEEMWGAKQPTDPGAVLQSNVSRLRRVLEPDGRIVARPPGYALEVDDADVDAWRFESLCHRARAAADPATAVAFYEQALAVDGSPFAEFADRDWARPDAIRLEEMRTTAREEYLSLRLDLGEDRAIVADLEALVSEHPLRERPWLLLALALHRSGRSADATRRIERVPVDPARRARAGSAGRDPRAREQDPGIRPGAVGGAAAPVTSTFADRARRVDPARRAQCRRRRHRSATR